jgi:hypothetical protein
VDSPASTCATLQVLVILPQAYTVTNHACIVI